ncbi:MAG: hypothetical protein QM708_00540 [Propioniciclava sp.]|uniref:AMIN-like domain-containing (lipo)protein n=1 Tax=Propioniciclava sp. TaxID=2038686 RepID=UPI0039E4172B
MKLRRFAATTAAAVIAVAGSWVAATPAQAIVCEAFWGSLPKISEDYNFSTVTNVRAGRHQCFDRLVIDVSGPAAGYAVMYVDEVRGTADQAVPLAGGAKLEVWVSAPTYDDDGEPTYRPANPNRIVNVTNYRTLRQVALVESFEGHTLIGLGVRARLPMRTFVLDGPGGGSRVVVDIAHLWY